MPEKKTKPKLPFTMGWAKGERPKKTDPERVQKEHFFYLTGKLIEGSGIKAGTIRAVRRVVVYDREIGTAKEDAIHLPMVNYDPRRRLMTVYLGNITGDERYPAPKLADTLDRAMNHPKVRSGVPKR